MTFVLKHHPGSLNKKADLLSRQKDHKEGVKDDNIGMTMLKKELFREIAVDLGGSGEELMKKIQKSKKIEDKVKEKVERKEKDWEEEDGICKGNLSATVESHTVPSRGEI